jgi:hypothetical protein
VNILELPRNLARALIEQTKKFPVDAVQLHA